MKHFTVEQLLQATGGTYYGASEHRAREIEFVTSDSRSAGPGALFIAFHGARADGHNFMAQCLKAGAACCLSEREPTQEEMPCVKVDSTLRAIGALAKWHRLRFDIPVVGITGSVGKTTTKEMIADVLSAHFHVHKTQKNFNNELGVPQTLLKLDETDEVSVIEMGISDFGEMRRLTNIVHPKIAVLSVIGDAHLEFLGDRAGVLRAKGEIFESMGPEDLAVLNGDDEYLRTFYPNTRRLTYGLGSHNDFVAKDVQNLGLEGVRCTICHDDTSFDVHIPGLGVHLVYAALAAAAVGHALGMTDEEIAAGIARYETVGDRARAVKTDRFTVISDCYNANPSSTAAAFASLKMLPGRHVCILGDMLELGHDTEALHEKTGELAAEAKIDLILTTGKLSRHTAEGAKRVGVCSQWFESKAALIQALPDLLCDGDNILVKASHSMAFEEITMALLDM